MAVAEGSPEPAPMEPVHCTPKASPSAGSPYRPSLHNRERSSPVKNRKREICTSGSARDEDGNVPIYSPERTGRTPPPFGWSSRTIRWRASMSAAFVNLRRHRTPLLRKSRKSTSMRRVRIHLGNLGLGSK